ncbi:S-adenosyl-L-methionine-dependent methyltransferase [Coccomyxa subellipsoidea C-169]|uniref:S-adenosyl-L-methionine-dependent methyltransferase n=1 Tax=Coccomyxa subellipsoidea (strain C-169) TaxID=574566 RepID=I0Z1C2_COCSC|nr:S-adenosyl-L-methionine-dependent methyltransferase [Coccomyxa subellipsoidea C-169]EIE24441.1 S-adenosyl-L-methionine-dependent methyltransferase [Coccomyxa subellipsoidea C-169]|eukprot:XP_005648985.1 S-adenosyl-L-methionine-dependent methyltransferase [Coccomyxa subellipsoidea C-169]
MDNDGSRIKQTQAAAWGNSAEQYAADVHEGAGIMMPLIAAYVETAKEEVKGNPQILDVASGTGEPGISLAKLFPGGTVTITDIAEGMIAGAKGRADRLSLKNARFAVADGENLSQFGDATFDVVTCNAGLMFMPNYERALAEFRRVLKPDGLAMVSAWGEEEQTNVASLMLAVQRAVAPNDSLFADPNILGSREKLLHSLERAGFSNNSCREVNVPMRFPKEKVRGMLQNPVIAELLDRLIERGEKDVADSAHGALLDAAAKKGLLQENGEISCPTNIALFVTARP